MSMVPALSKVFEKMQFEQITDHIQNKFSKHLTGFRKNHGTQVAPVVIIEK